MPPLPPNHNLYSPDAETDVLEGTLNLAYHLERALRDPANPLARMMDRARQDYVVAVKDIITADLVTSEGIAQARQIQANIHRYRDLVLYICEFLDAGTLAREIIESGEQMDPQTIEELGSMTYGRRGKPITDA